MFRFHTEINSTFLSAMLLFASSALDKPNSNMEFLHLGKYIRILNNNIKNIKKIITQSLKTTSKSRTIPAIGGIDDSENSILHLLQFISTLAQSLKSS